MQQCANNPQGHEDARAGRPLHNAGDRNLRGACARLHRVAFRAVAITSALLALALASPTTAKTQRDPHQRALFMHKHPCPANSNTRGRCPGFVVDHVVPLCAGGKDHPTNMQWQTVADAKVKDRRERQMCSGKARDAE
jgi:hypothetical protein